MAHHGESEAATPTRAAKPCASATEQHGKALSFALKQWEQLHICLENGHVELDNNLVENAIRPSAIGKKNWLFIADSEAGVRAATFYTLVGNCQQLGIDAYKYLLGLFTRLPSMTKHQVKVITPLAWTQHKQHTGEANICQEILKGVI